jgi:hypothetical protein
LRHFSVRIFCPFRHLRWRFGPQGATARSHFSANEKGLASPAAKKYHEPWKLKDGTVLPPPAESFAPHVARRMFLDDSYALADIYLPPAEPASVFDDLLCLHASFQPAKQAGLGQGKRIRSGDLK